MNEQRHSYPGVDTPGSGQSPDTEMEPHGQTRGSHFITRLRQRLRRGHPPSVKGDIAPKRITIAFLLALIRGFLRRRINLCDCLVIDPCGCIVDPCDCVVTDERGCYLAPCGCEPR